MGTKVSVVVPVYNAGEYIEACVRSLLGQTMPITDHEVIFVDDGSTDGSWERVEAVAAARRHIRALRIDNSGGPGLPRNMGLDLARGEYVYFLDADDWLGSEALERMHAMASRNGSDVLVGKLVGQGRRVPRSIFQKDRDRAEILPHHLLSLLTPHKLFRTAFLREHGLRFPEGPVRLEDHRFCVPAYFKAEVISVLADYPCCYWVKRKDEGNYSFQRFEPEHYFAALREVLDVVDEHVPAGATRDRYYAHWLRGKMLRRLGGKILLSYPPEYRREFYEAVRELVLERFPVEVDRLVPQYLRPRAALLRAGAFEDLERLAEGEAGITVRPELKSAVLDGTVPVFGVSAALVHRDGTPVTFRREDGDDKERVLWEPPAALTTPVPEEALDVTGALPRSQFTVSVRHRDTKVEVDLALTARREPCEGATAWVRFDAEARLEGAADLPPGLWDLRVRLNTCGWTVERKVPGVRVHVSFDGRVELRRKAPPAKAPVRFRALRRTALRVPGLRQAVRFVRP